MSFKVRLTKVGEARAEILLSRTFKTISEALEASHAPCVTVFKDQNFSFSEVTRHVFMIVRNGDNAGLIVMNEV